MTALQNTLWQINRVAITHTTVASSKTVWYTLLLLCKCTFKQHYQKNAFSQPIGIIKTYCTALVFIVQYCDPYRYRWLAYINPNYYGFSATAFLLLNDFKTGCTGSQFECYASSGEYYLEQFTFENVNPYLYILVRH